MPAGLVIGDHALLSDCQGAALVSREGVVTWWSAPRFDSPSCFAQLLDADAGHCTVAPTAPFDASRAYRDGTFVLETEMRTSAGSVRVTDALAMAPGARVHQIGLDVPHAMVRLVEGLAGEVEVGIEVVPRLEYGLAVPTMVRTPVGVASVGGPERLFVQAPDAAWDLGASSARARVTVRAGERVGIVLHRRAGVLAEAPAPLDPQSTLADTTEAWRSWRDGHDHLSGPQRELVQRSVLTLQALTYQPTGALVAAATTSVVETPGNDGAWDYRFAWLRDASLVARALDVSHCADEGDRHFRFMARSATTCAQSSHVQIVFGVEGERELAERRLEHLGGYGGGGPVRVGNAAWHQRQLDVLGEVLDVAASRVERHGLELEPYEQWFLCRLADRAAEDWSRPDAGLWELRDRDRHHTFSKVMCWVALDRAVRLARGGALGPEAPARVAAWARERERVHEAVLRDAWDPERRTLRGTLDGGDPWLDTAVLLLPAFGFLPADDPRMLGTVRRIREELGDGGLLRRSSAADDRDTAFLICSGWLADCHARAGELDRAEAVLDELTGCANDLGLLAERAQFGTRAPAGNFPQALSHVGLVNASSTIRLEEEARAAAA